MVGVGVNVGTGVGVGVGDGTGVAVRTGVGVGVMVGASVNIGAAVGVGTVVGVAVNVGAGVGTAVGVGVNVGTGVGAGTGDGVLKEDSRGRTVAATPSEIASCACTFAMTSFWTVCSVSFTDCDGVGVSTQEAASSKTIIRRSAMCAICPRVCASYDGDAPDRRHQYIRRPGPKLLYSGQLARTTISRNTQIPCAT